MDDTSSDSLLANETLGDDAGDDRTEESFEVGRVHESEESSNAAAIAAAVEEEEVDIIESDQEATLAEMEMEMEEPEQEVDSTKVSTESEASSSGVVEDEKSSESDGGEETESRMIFQNLPPNFPSRFTTLISNPEEISPRILIEKRLRKADVDESRDRLSISAKKMKEAFLQPEEEEKLKSGEVLEVVTIEPDGRLLTVLTLRRRRRESASYVLTGGWKYVVARNSEALKRGRFIRVWYFRAVGGLKFGIQIVKFKDCQIGNQMSQKWYGQNVYAP